MSKPVIRLTAGQILDELHRAERHGREGNWRAADSVYLRICAEDSSPGSRIAFGSSLAEREHFHAAICQLTLALDAATETGDREALAVIFHNLAAIYRELGDADLARRFQQRALLQQEDCGRLELLGLGNDACASQRAELAICLFSSCADLDDGTVEDDVAVEAQASLATVTGLTEDPRAGLRSLLAITRGHIAQGEHRLAGIDLLNVSLLVSAMGWYQAELRLVQRAIQYFDKAPAPVSAAKARLVLAQLQRAQSLREFDPSVN